MRKHFLIVIVLYCIGIQTVNAQAANCILVIKIDTLNRSDFSFIAIANSEAEYYLDTIGNKLDSICLTVNDPEKVTLQIGDITPENMKSNLLPLWLHKGRYVVHINLIDTKVSFEKSDINVQEANARHYMDSLRSLKPYKSTLDSLYALKEQTDSSRKLIKIYYIEFDKYEKTVAEEMYKYHAKDKSSFLTLDFISFHLGANYKYIAKDKLKTLFSRLGKSLHTYKKYKDCKMAFKMSNNKPTVPLINIKM